MDRLRELHVSVYAVKFGGKPDGTKNQTLFTTKSAEMFWMLRKDLIEGKLAVPPDSKLRSQLTGIDYEVESDRAIRVHKQGKKKQSASPDMADALALAVEARNRSRVGILASFA